MNLITDILALKLKPADKRNKLAEALVSGMIPARDFMAWFEKAGDKDKGTAADVMKHVAAERPDLLAPYMDLLRAHIRHKAARVRWGVPEAIGHIAADYPDTAAQAMPELLQNLENIPANPTVVRWCAAFALCGIALHHIPSRGVLLPILENTASGETNSGVKNLIFKTLKQIGKAGGKHA